MLTRGRDQTAPTFCSAISCGFTLPKTWLRRQRYHRLANQRVAGEEVEVLDVAVVTAILAV